MLKGIVYCAVEKSICRPYDYAMHVSDNKLQLSSKATSVTVNLQQSLKHNFHFTITYYTCYKLHYCVIKNQVKGCCEGMFVDLVKCVGRLYGGCV